MMLSGYLFFSATLDENLENPSRWPSIGDASNPNENNPFHESYKKFIKDLKNNTNQAPAPAPAPAPPS